MPKNPGSRLTVPPHFFFKGQLTQLLVLTLLVLVAAFLIDWERLASLSFLGMSGSLWAILAIAVAPIQQFLVWFVWRSEIIYARISPLFGGRGFQIYALVFGVLLLARPLLILGLGLADRGSLRLPWLITWLLAPLVGMLVLYTMFSVGRYFGFERAVGGDHFFEKYRQEFVKQGIFKSIDNAMYTIALLVLLLIGVWTFSQAAIIVGVFHYLAVWTHYFCTEKPDIELLYSA